MNEGFQYYDMFATKGIEYLVVIAFLAGFVLYWRWLNKPNVKKNQRATSAPKDWFRITEDRYYHPGHSWAKPQKDGSVKIGLDDFALKMLGKIDKLILNPKHRNMKQGDADLQLEVASRHIPILSPVDGEIVEVNKELTTHSTTDTDWLVRVRSENLKSNLHNLLHGSLAQLWIRSEIRQLNTLMGNRLGYVLQDGGVPIDGFARELNSNDWEHIAQQFLRTEDI